MQYLAGSLIGWLVWLFFFLRRPDLRREMIVMGLLAAPLALIDLYIVPRYWNPVTLFNFPGGIEGLMFFFQAGGIAAVSYEFVKNKSLVKIKNFKIPVVPIILMTVLFFLILLVGYLVGLNPGLVQIIFGVLSLLILVVIRKDLLESALVGGVVFAGIYFSTLAVWLMMFPEAQHWYTLEGLPKIYLFRVPIYEILIAFTTGAVMGNMYEVLFGYRYGSR